MDEATIRGRMQAASDRFNELKAKADSIEEELHRLQGEYRGLEALLSPTPDPATTVEAIPQPAEPAAPTKTKGKK